VTKNVPFIQILALFLILGLVGSNLYVLGALFMPASRKACSSKALLSAMSACSLKLSMAKQRDLICILLQYNLFTFSNGFSKAFLGVLAACALLYLWDIQPCPYGWHANHSRLKHGEQVRC